MGWQFITRNLWLLGYEQCPNITKLPSSLNDFYLWKCCLLKWKNGNLRKLCSLEKALINEQSASINLNWQSHK